MGYSGGLCHYAKWNIKNIVDFKISFFMKKSRSNWTDALSSKE
jgi:hypothetical protein